MAVRNGFPHALTHPKVLLPEIEEMSKLPERIKKKLKAEAFAWDASVAGEKPEKVARLLNKAEPFNAVRPPRQPVSLRLDPMDLSMAKRIARRKGIPFTQLFSMWLHEKVAEEQGKAGS
jgi:predicted DNA binding CopG/RHH family protein